MQNIYGKRLINTWWWCDDERKKIGTLPLCFPRGDSAKEKMLGGWWCAYVEERNKIRTKIGTQWWINVFEKGVNVVQ